MNKTCYYGFRYISRDPHNVRILDYEKYDRYSAMMEDTAVVFFSFFFNTDPSPHGPAHHPVRM